MKRKIQRAVLSLLLLTGLPVVPASCNLLVFDNNSNSQTSGASCLEEVWVGYMYPAQLCYEWLAKQNAGEELNVPVSQSDCDGQFLLALVVFQHRCEDE